MVQAIFSQPTLTQSLSDHNNLKRMSSAWGKRMTSAWGKRMSSAWGKRADLDNDDLYSHLMQELVQQARWNKYEHPRYSLENEANPFGIEQYLVQRSASNNNDDDAALAAQNMS